MLVANREIARLHDIINKREKELLNANEKIQHLNNKLEKIINHVKKIEAPKIPPN